MQGKTLLGEYIGRFVNRCGLVTSKTLINAPVQ